MPRPSRPAAGLLIAFAAGLLSLPACNKKKSTQPDSTPEDPNQNTDRGQNNTPSDPKLAPGLPSPPAQRPLFVSGVLAGPQRQTSARNLQQIALAFHNFHDERNGFPVGIADKSGKIGLSWRVAILPLVGEKALYDQFKLDEPWDSETNKKLIPKMPPLYGPPNWSTNGYTFYRSFSGPGAIMQEPKGVRPTPGQPVLGARFTSITDGTSNTFLVAEAYDPVIWTKPEDLPFAPGKPPRLGGGLFDSGFHAALCDGSVRSFGLDLSPQTLSKYITIAGGEIIE